MHMQGVTSGVRLCGKTPDPLENGPSLWLPGAVWRNLSGCHTGSCLAPPTRPSAQVSGH